MSATSKISQEHISKASSSAHSATPSIPNRGSDFLSGLEQQMKELWAQYVRCLDQNGLSDSAKKLRSQYYSLYRCYRQNKDWKSAINNN
jgi:hypothetical protein